MSSVKWTPSEQQALMVSMQHFGICNCRPPGHGSLARVCDGHSFLSETDRRVDRPMHMLYVRRTRQQWLDSEWMGKTPPGGEIQQPVLPPRIQAPEPSKQAPPEDDASQTLPW